MSNLSDLLPAGASAKQITATDSGSGIASKAPVVMSASGTVSAVSETSSGNSAATASQYDAAVLFYYGSMVYDPDTQRVVLAYIDTNNSYYASIVVGEASASGVTWGTPVTVYSGQTVNFIAACYDTTNDRVGVAYNRYGGGAWYAGYSIDGGTNTPSSIATHVQFSTGNEYYIDLAYHPGENVIVSVSTTMAYSPNRGKVSVARLGASSITLGNEEFFDPYGATVYPQAQSAFNLIYESNLAELIVNFADASNSGYMTTCVISPAGTGSATFGAYNVYVSEQSYNNTLTFDENSGKLLYTYRRSSTSPTFRGAAKVGLASGTSVTVDATENYFTSTGQAREQDAAYDATAKKIGLVYYVYSSGSETRFVDATTSASDYSVTFGTDVAAYTAVTSGAGAASLMAYDSALGKLVWAFNNSATGISQSTILTVANTTTNLTAQAFVGVADSAISASAAGSIIVQGGTVTGPTTDVAVAENVGSNIPWGDASKANSAPVTAYGNNDVLIAYYINDGTTGARVVAGTIGGGTISFGTDDVISADASVLAYYYGIAYDSTNDTYIVSWFDHNDSSKLYAAVVSLTGNVISHAGTTAIVSTANVGNAQTLSAVYDPDTQRVIFTYCSAVDTYAYAVVCEASSTEITTVGTPAKIDSSSANNGYANRIAACYDTTEDKIIATYCYYGGGGTYYLRAAAGTVNGGTNSISWGSSVPVLSQEGNYLYIAYNATDQRVVFNYQDATGTGYLTSSVASVSGTTITVGATPSVILTGTNYYPSVVHDATANKMVSYFRGSLSYAYVASGAINTATNTITYSTPTLVTSASLSTQNQEHAVYDPTIGKCILVSAGNSVGETACSIYTTATTLTDQPLTTGTKYFVTTAGKFSTTAGDPSVNAGLAISTTQLLLNGDS
jgi:hypothetical protein